MAASYRIGQCWSLESIFLSLITYGSMLSFRNQRQRECPLMILWESRGKHPLISPFEVETVCAFLTFLRLLLAAPNFLIRSPNVMVKTDKPRTCFKTIIHIGTARRSWQTQMPGLCLCCAEVLGGGWGAHISPQVPVILGHVVLPKKAASEAKVHIYQLSSYNYKHMSVPGKSSPHQLLISTMSGKVLIHPSLIFSIIWNRGVRTAELCLLGQAGT